MADYLVNSDELTAIADAIREKAALQNVPLLYPFGFVTEIMNIPQEWDDDFIRALIERTFTQFSNSRIRSAGAYTFAGCSRLSVVNLPNLVSFSPNMFQSCVALVDVEFPNVMYGATAVFSDCFNLEFINLPMYQESARVWISNSYYSYRAIPSSMFYRCSKLIDIGGIDFESIEYVGTSTFNGCSLFGRINDFVNLKNTGTGAFGSCQNLYEVEFTQLRNVAYGTFSGCSNLQTASFPIASYVSGWAFAYDRSLSQIYAPLCESVGDYAFYGCSSLEEINMPLCKSLSRYAFEGCRSVSRIYMPLVSQLSSRSMSAWTTGGYFEYCSNLSELIISNDLFASIVPAYTFENCQKLPFDNLNFATCSVIGSSAFSSCYLLSYFYAPNCSMVFDGAFAYCSNLTSIIINYSMISCVSSNTYRSTGISTASFPNATFIGSYAFAFCKSLQQAYFPKCTIVNYEAFWHCDALESITLPLCSKLDTWAFEYCSNLSYVSLPVCKTISSSAFYSCPSLQTIYLPECSSIGSACFGYCITLSNIDLPKCTYLGPCAFTNCSQLLSVNLPLCSNIESYTFSYCYRLTDIDLPNCTSVGSWAFGYCYSLSNISLPKCSIVHQSAFYGCSKLTNISLPSCQVLSSSAFYGAASHATIYIPKCYSIGSYALPTYIESITFGSSYSVIMSYTLQYYSGSYLDLPYIKEIRGYGIYYGSGLQAVSLPACTKLSSSAFHQTTGLKSVYLTNSTVTSIDFDPSQVFTYGYRSIKFYVPASLLNTYKTSPRWSLVSSQFYSIY